MKVRIEQIISFIISLIIAACLSVWISSCSATYHLDKFYKKGGKIEAKKTEVIIHDTLHINGKDSIIEKTIHIDCPEPTAPLTRYETKWKYRIKHDSIMVEKWRTKYIYKTVKQENKTTRTKTRSSWIWLPFVCLLALAIWLITLNRKDDKRKDLF